MPTYPTPPANSSGVPYVDPKGVTPVYSAYSNFVPASGILYTLQGSDTKVIVFHKLTIGGTAGGQPGSLILSQVLATSLPTGGVAVSVPAFAHDQNDPAATAVAYCYTTAPTTGTVVGTYNISTVGFPAPGQATNLTGPDTFVPSPGEKGIILRGSNQVFQIQTTSSALLGGQIQIGVVWSEQPFYP